MNKVQQHDIYSEIEVTELLSDLFDYESQYIATILQFDRLLMLGKHANTDNNFAPLEVITKSLKEALFGRRLSVIKIIGYNKILVLSVCKNETQPIIHIERIKRILFFNKIVPVKHLNIGHVYCRELDEPCSMAKSIFNCKLTRFTSNKNV